MYAGGIRIRVIEDSFYTMLEESLDSRGWFDAGRYHTPITMVAADIPFEEEIQLNTLAVSWGDYFSDEWEMGSILAEHNLTVYVDFYAQNDSVGQELIHDVAAVCAGRLPTIGRNGPVFDVYDYTVDPSPQLFTCEIEDILIDKARNFPKPWMRHWWSLQARVIDYYATEAD